MEIGTSRCVSGTMSPVSTAKWLTDRSYDCAVSAITEPHSLIPLRATKPTTDITEINCPSGAFFFRKASVTSSRDRPRIHSGILLSCDTIAMKRLNDRDFWSILSSSNAALRHKSRGVYAKREHPIYSMGSKRTLTKKDPRRLLGGGPDFLDRAYSHRFLRNDCHTLGVSAAQKTP